MWRPGCCWVSRRVGTSCVKYVDLSHNRNHEYILSFFRMLDNKGNTTYTMLRSIARKAKVEQQVVELNMKVRFYTMKNVD